MLKIPFRIAVLSDKHNLLITASILTQTHAYVVKSSKTTQKRVQN